MKTLLAVLCLLLLTAPLATAEVVTVNIIGTVEYNLVGSGDFANVNPGDPVEVSFTVDSNDFINSPTFPVRSYKVQTYSLTMGSVTAALNPTPTNGIPYFGVRDNDPAVDGFYFTRDGGDFPAGWQLDEPANVAGTRYFEQRFNVTYEGTRLSSLDILGAVGNYDYTGLSVFGFAVDDLGFDPIGIEFVMMTISAPVAVENVSWGNVKALFRD